MLVRNGHLLWCSTLREPCHCKTSGYVVAGLLAALTAVLEFWGSGESGSLALLGDAWHVASDAVVYAVAIGAGMLSVKNTHRAADIKARGALMNANVLIAVASVTIALALWRVVHPTEVLVGTMLWVATIGLSVNACMYLVLKAFKIEHGHGHEHGDHLHDTAILHTLNDTLISFAVVVTGGIAYLCPAVMEWRIDSAASIGICVWLIAMAIKTKREVHKTAHHD